MSFVGEGDKHWEKKMHTVMQGIDLTESLSESS